MFTFERKRAAGPMFTFFRILIVCSVFASCISGSSDTATYVDTAVTITGGNIDTPQVNPVPGTPPLVSGTADKDAIVDFAETLKGITYKYGSIDPAVGFDCSGFITYVFNHFNIKVPRSSVDFTNVGKEVPVTQAQRGDLILFTGTDSTVRIVGHMGIVTSNTDTLKFIHSTSGKAFGVTESPLSSYYKGRFVKVIDIF